MTVGERIEQKRKENNLSMEALGDLLGVGKSAINKWEKGYVQRISRPMIIKMAKIFDCDPAWLGGYSDSETSDNANTDSEDNKEIAVAVKKYKQYKNLPEEFQKTIDVLLEQGQSDS